MRRLSTTVRSVLSHSAQSVALTAVAGLCLAFAPAERADVPAVRPVAAPVVAVAEPAGPMTRLIAFGEPVPGRAINSRFGMRRLGGEPGVRMHKGVDIAAPQGTHVVATADGVVMRTDFQPQGYGRMIEVRHPNGLTSLYAHLSRVDVASGDRVEAGERIGLVGSTGYSTGPHLHFEIRREGAQVDPSRVIGRIFQIRVEG